MLKHDGIPSADELQEVLPPAERMRRGPVAIIECFQDIPCDPCVAACPVHAITMRDGITDKPRLDSDKCTGCTLCVAGCPGLAIFVVDLERTETHAAVTLPHELLPVPKVGEKVTGLDRAGREVGQVEVIRVLNTAKQDHTAVVTVLVPRELAMQVRAIRPAGPAAAAKR